MKDRIADIDIIRGYAIFGILICNIVLFHTPLEYSFQYFNLHNSWGDNLSEFIRFAYFGDRTYLLFSMLFGVGIGMQYIKSKESKYAFTSYHTIRMILLLFIGMFHAAFLWYGDILAMYALLGLLSLLFIRLNPKHLFSLSFIIYLIPTLLTVLARNKLFSISFPVDDLKPLADLITLNTKNGILGHISYNLSQVLSTIQFYLSGNLFSSFSMLLFGLAIAKLGLQQKINDQLWYYRKLVLIMLPIVCIWTIYYLFIFDPPSIKTSFQFYTYWSLFTLSGIGQTFLVIGVIVLLNRKMKWWLRIAHGLSYLGRMSLTNYLLQSLIGVIIFKIIGLYGKSTPILDMFMVLGITISQIIFSKWWLSNYGLGPIETIWRKASKSLVP